MPRKQNPDDKLRQLERIARQTKSASDIAEYWKESIRRNILPSPWGTISEIFSSWALPGIGFVFTDYVPPFLDDGEEFNEVDQSGLITIGIRFGASKAPNSFPLDVDVPDFNISEIEEQIFRRLHLLIQEFEQSGNRRNPLDDRLRKLQKSGDDPVRELLERERAGLISSSVIEAAASMDHPIARQVHPEHHEVLPYDFDNFRGALAQRFMYKCLKYDSQRIFSAVWNIYIKSLNKVIENRSFENSRLSNSSNIPLFFETLLLVYSVLNSNTIINLSNQTFKPFLIQDIGFIENFIRSSSPVGPGWDPVNQHYDMLKKFCWALRSRLLVSKFNYLLETEDIANYFITLVWQIWLFDHRQQSRGNAPDFIKCQNNLIDETLKSDLPLKPPAKLL